MKFILYCFFYCSIACASGDGWDKCEKTPPGSSNELAQIFRPEAAANEQDSTTEEQEPTVEEQTPSTEAVSAQESLTNEQNKNDKNQKTNLGFLSKYPFLTHCGLAIPCATVIIYLAYRWRR